MRIVHSDRHEVYSVEVNKVALSSKDGKRHVLEDKKTYVSSWTLPFKKLIEAKWYRHAGHPHHPNNIIYRLLKYLIKYIIKYLI